MALVIVFLSVLMATVAQIIANSNATLISIVNNGENKYDNLTQQAITYIVKEHL